MNIPVLGARPRFVARREKTRHAPLEISEAVALWGRKHNRSARIRWYHAPMNCWAVLLGYKEGDPRAADGTQDEPVFLHEWKSEAWWRMHEPHRAPRHYRTRRIKAGYRAFELDELGAEGVIKWLDKGDILSARGQFDSVQDVGDYVEQDFRTTKHRRRLFHRDEAHHRAVEHFRDHVQIRVPFTNYAIKLGRGKTKEATP